MAYLIGKPPVFWNHPGTPTLPWTRWLEDFEIYLIAAGGESFSVERKAASVPSKHCLNRRSEASTGCTRHGIGNTGSTKDAYPVLVQTLTIKFSPSDVVATARLSFRNLVQGESSRQDFLFELKDTANQCDFGVLISCCWNNYSLD
ncbi:hypothetical protein MTO96_044515 [Rhipicephalus appendiculatus]